MSKNSISFLLCEVIVQSGASPEEVATPRAHGIRSITTSSAFFKNWSIPSVLESASWKSNYVFTSFYFKDLQYDFEGVRSLGPFVAAGERIGYPPTLPDLLWGRRECYRSAFSLVIVFSVFPPES